MSHPLEALLREAIKDSPFAWKDKIFLVGGFVRDQLLGQASPDLDVVIEHPGGAEALTAYLSRTIPQFSKPHLLGKNYPIWQLVHDTRTDVEFADTHSEMFPDPRTRQRVVVYGSQLEDCRRRDFTVNMLYRRLIDGDLQDPSRVGIADLKAGQLRCHPDVAAEKIFSDDPLRILRLFRFKARWNFTVEARTRAAAQSQIHRLGILSPERIRDELKKVMVQGKLSEFLEDLRLAGTWPQLFPELLPMVDCEQDKIYHAEGDVWTHTRLVMEKVPPTEALQLAALLHDVAKPQTQSRVGERIKFLEHERVGVAMAEAFLKRLKFEKAIVEKVTLLVRLHLRGGDVTAWKSLKPARKLLREAGEHLEDLLALIAADSGSSLDSAGKARTEHIILLREKLAEAAQSEARIPKDALLTGSEIMTELNIGSGPQVKILKERLQEIGDDFADRGEVLTREWAVQELRRFFVERFT